LRTLSAWDPTGGTVGATTMAAVEFAETTTGTYFATLDIFNDGVVTTVSVTLPAKVLEDIISASGVETWRRY